MAKPRNDSGTGQTSRDKNQPNVSEVNYLTGKSNPVGANRESGSGLPKQPAEVPHKLDQVANPGKPANNYAGTSRDSK